MGAQITARVYDPRNVPMDAKAGLTIGMAMTENRAVRTCRPTARAYPWGQGARARPMNWWATSISFRADVRRLPGAGHADQGPVVLSAAALAADGTEPLQVLRLKTQDGQRLNASSETELRGALAGWWARKGAACATSSRWWP